MENPYLCSMQLFEKITRSFNTLRSNRVFRILTDKFTLVTIAAAVLFTTDRNGIITLWKNRSEIASQQAAIKKYQQQISQIEGRIESLSSDRDSIEAYAREEYYYRRDGEDIFIVQ